MSPRQHLVFLLLCAVTHGAESCDGLAEPLATAPSGTDSRPAVNYREPLRVYETVHLGAWTLRVEKQLMQADEALARKALARLERKLCALDAIIPDAALPNLHRMAIYLMYGEKANQGGLASGASYYKQNAPEFQKNIDLRWRNCVVIKSAENYAKLPELWSIKVLMHELAHAFQLQQWPEKQPEILRAWNHAKQQGLYRHGTGHQGGRQAQAYAMTNQLEYFAELSCMYFVGCNYFPFTREELKRYDPSGYDMIERMWRVGPAAGFEGSERM